MTDKLLPCPFCGGEAETLTAESMHDGYLFGIMCNDCRSRGDVYDDEAEAIAAWNARAATTIGKVQVEVKPVLRGTLTAEQVRKAVYAHSIHADCADADWQAIADELNTRAERTCHWEYPQSVNGWVGYTVCSNCGEKYDECITNNAHYCPNCGARVIGTEAG